MKIRLREDKIIGGYGEKIPKGSYKAELCGIKSRSGNTNNGKIWNGFMLIFKIIKGRYKGQCANGFYFISIDKNGYSCIVKDGPLYNILIRLNNSQDIENLDIYDFLDRTINIKISNKLINGKFYNVIDNTLPKNYSLIILMKYIEKATKQYIRRLYKIFNIYKKGEIK